VVFQTMSKQLQNGCDKAEVSITLYVVMFILTYVVPKSMPTTINSVSLSAMPGNV
jgi:hypothetical protein